MLLPKATVRFKVNLVVGNPDPATGFTGHPEDLVATGQISRHRLLQQDIATVLKRSHCNRHVEVVRQADVNQIGGSLLDQLADVAENRNFNSDRFNGQIPVEFTDRDEIGSAFADSPQMNLADFTEPAESNLHGASPSSAATCSRASLAAAAGSLPSTCS